jgi:5'-nucleotidase
VVKELAGFLRNIGCDVVIALGHQGYNRDVAMAAAVPELDVVVGGHSHTDLAEPTRVPAQNPTGYVLVTQAWEWGKTLGVLKLRFERDTAAERLRLADYENEYQPMTPQLPEDDGLKAFISDYNNRFAAEMSKVVCESLMDFPVADVRTQENALANMVADALRATTGADIALFNGGNFRAGIDSGPVSFGDLYEVMPYDNFLLKVKLSGAELRAALEAGGAQYGDGGFPQVSGMRLRYLDGRLVDVSIGGEALDPAREYSLLITDFVGRGGDGYPFNEPEYGPSMTGLEQRASFALWASQQGELSYSTDGRVVFEWSSGEPPKAGD